MHEYKLKLAVALGGLLVFIGIILIGLFAMVVFDFIDIGALERQEYRTLSLGVFLGVGILDLLSGILLRRR
jgi:hypothetical protein